MIYQIVIVLSLGGDPQTYVSKREFPDLKSCNAELVRLSKAYGDWAATCQPAFKA